MASPSSKVLIRAWTTLNSLSGIEIKGIEWMVPGVTVLLDADFVLCLLLIQAIFGFVGCLFASLLVWTERLAIAGC
jgi:hypothetical protein